jgi:hypothetical protein
VEWAGWAEEGRCPALRKRRMRIPLRLLIEKRRNGEDNVNPQDGRSRIQLLRWLDDLVISLRGIGWRRNHGRVNICSAVRQSETRRPAV